MISFYNLDSRVPASETILTSVPKTFRQVLALCLGGYKVIDPCPACQDPVAGRQANGFYLNEPHVLITACDFVRASWVTQLS